ncbi:MAG: UvrD-helicase domain-containing protein [Marinifilaceae bacterium]|jgi:ATP-dependent exoDNAse (exonuclease V) beta subunit|nr:UvrD-helicase domain-containing protein [Marinifilaceae bacterium]
MSEIKIYRASAGSGKTYTLTQEYLKLLFLDINNYKHILAVTFTNKATEEMKSRIIGELSKIANHDNSDHENILCEFCKLSKTELKARAKEALHLILHDYSRFSITTIDSFFQKLIRAFTREIGLQIGYQIELDQNKILETSAELLINDINANPLLKKWLLEFAESKMSDTKSFNIKPDITKIGQQLFNEELKGLTDELINKISNKEFLSSYKNALVELKKEIENSFQKIGESSLNALNSAGLAIEDFSFGKSGVIGYLIGLKDTKKYKPGVRAKNSANQPESWFKKTTGKSKKEILLTCINSELNPYLNAAIELYNNQGLLYESIDTTLSNIYTLGIISDLSSKMREYNSDNNIFMLSDSSLLLRKIIGENQNLFIYEKIGQTYKYFMIDEFQDTSSMQWSNFKPLIINTLAEGDNSLVVGDVKQSIYRWRNGDWNILHNQINKDFAQFKLNALSLDNNWRSLANVINFNNYIYQTGSDILQSVFNDSIPENIRENFKEYNSTIKEVYSDSFQYCPKKDIKSGYIHLKYFEKTDDEISINDQILEELPLYIEELQEKGYSAKDIAILVRTGKEGAMVADKLMEYSDSELAKPHINYNIISNDSLYIANSKIVKFIIGIFEYMVNQDNTINNAFLNKFYHHNILKADLSEIDINLFNKEKDIINFPEKFINNISNIRSLPVYSQAEYIMDIFNLGDYPNEIVYLNSFLDMVQKYTINNGSDTKGFLEFWDERKDKQVISVSDSQDAIRIITIHKSKGLEFEAVILPFCNWQLDSQKHGNLLWCRPSIEGFDALELVPVAYGSKLENTIYYREFYKERLQSFVDNLNLLYVATTRAEKALYICSNLNKKKEIKHVGDLIYHCIKNGIISSESKHYNDIENISPFWNNDEMKFEYGEIKAKKANSIKELKQEINNYPVNLMDTRVKLRTNSSEYFDFNQEASMESFTPVSEGNLIHRLFQDINYKDDLDRAIAKLVFEGKINTEQEQELYLFAKNLLDSDLVQDWFDKEWKVMNERDILTGKENQYRPDRIIYKDDYAIVIDYKFGNKKSKNYKYQVKKYKDLLFQTGFKNVEGYILYGKLGETEKI